MIIGHAHTCFIVSDLAQIVDFYVNKLGLKLAFDFRREDGARFGVYIRLGNRTFLEFFEGSLNARAEQQSYAHLCLECDDVARTVDEFRSRGVDVSDPILGIDQSWQAWLSDPVGNRIELHAYTPASWQTPHL